LSSSSQRNCLTRIDELLCSYLCMCSQSSAFLQQLQEYTVLPGTWVDGDLKQVCWSNLQHICAIFITIFQLWGHAHASWICHTTFGTYNGKHERGVHLVHPCRHAGFQEIERTSTNYSPPFSLVNSAFFA
jgi:hypothetical protein